MQRFYSHLQAGFCLLVPVRTRRCFNVGGLCDQSRLTFELTEVRVSHVTGPG